MAGVRWERFAPLTGIAAVVLWVIGVTFLESGETGDETPADLVAYFESDENSVYAGAILFLLGTGLFLWFAASLREALLRAEGGTGRLTSIVQAASIATAVAVGGLVAPNLSGAFAANEADAPLEPAAAQALYTAGDGFFVVGEFAVALLFVATSILILRTRVFPVWLAWVSLLLAVVLVIPPIGWAALIFAFPLWIIVVALFLFLRTPAPEPAPEPALERPVPE